MQTAKQKLHTTLNQVLIYLPAALLVVFALVEFFSKYQRYMGHTTVVQKAAKAAVIMLLLGGLCLQLKKTKSILMRLLGLCLVFVLGQMLISPNFDQRNLLTLSRFLFPLILFWFFSVYPISEKARELLFAVFEWFLVVNFIFIATGLLADVYVLKTYLGDRFGYNGLLLTSSTSTYFYYCALAYFYFVYGLKAWTKWRFWLVFISCVLIGTKSLYLGVLLLFLVILLFEEYRYKRWIVSAAIAAMFIFLYLLLFQFPQFKQLTTEEGFITALLSYRDQLFLEQTWPYIQQNWNIGNYAFGGVTDFSLRSQMEIVDVFFFWGILGGGFYLHSYLRSYFTFKPTRTQIGFFVVLATIVILAGNFFTYTSIPLYLLILRESILSRSKTRS